MPKARAGNFTLRTIVRSVPADKAAHRMTALQRSGAYSELRFIQRGKSAFDIVGYKWPDKGVRRALGIGSASRNPAAFTHSQLAELRRAYAGIKTAPVRFLERFRQLFAKMSDVQLQQVSTADIRFVSKLAQNELSRRGRNPSQAGKVSPNQVKFGMRGKTVVGWINRETPTRYEINYKAGAALRSVWRDKNKVKFQLSGRPGRVRNVCPKAANPAEAVNKAMRLSKSFHGFDPRRIKGVDLDWPKALVCLGPCVRLDYYSDKHDGKPRIYFHEFEKPAAVYAAESPQPDGTNLLIIHGHFSIKPEGITG